MRGSGVRILFAAPIFTGPFGHIGAGDVLARWFHCGHFCALKSSSLRLCSLPVATHAQQTCDLSKPKLSTRLQIPPIIFSLRWRRQGRQTLSSPVINTICSRWAPSSAPGSLPRDSCLANSARRESVSPSGRSRQRAAHCAKAGGRAADPRSSL